jgi:hypothetical protein
MRIQLVPLLLLALSAHPAVAQTEAALRAYFEGKSIRVNMEMPGSDDGVDVFPVKSQPIDFRQHAARLKQFGTAIKRGDEVLITKVKLKDDLIEFQLGGGGYGTFGDDTYSSVSVPSAPKTAREKNLEGDLKKTTDPAARRKINEELDALRKEREREDARNRAATADAQQLKEANIRQKRLEAGSRFNIRYGKPMPSEVATPEGVMRALAEYVDFSPMGGPASRPVASQANQPSQATQVKSSARPDDLRKGLTADEVDVLLGRPSSISERKEGTLVVQTSVYKKDGRSISAEFVEGVLIRYTIRSQ